MMGKIHCDGRAHSAAVCELSDCCEKLLDRPPKPGSPGGCSETDGAGGEFVAILNAMVGGGIMKDVPDATVLMMIGKARLI
jgi:hypothetical protein